MGEKTCRREPEESGQKCPSNSGQRRAWNVLPATTKTALPNANRSDGHTHLLICDNRTMDKTIGMKVTAASTSRLQLS
jgi:hypothetical protein